jgi:hypothetical protein
MKYNILKKEDEDIQEIKCECESGQIGRPFGFCNTICDICTERKSYHYLTMIDDIVKRRD